MANISNKSSNISPVTNTILFIFLHFDIDNSFRDPNLLYIFETPDVRLFPPFSVTLFGKSWYM